MKKIAVLGCSGSIGETTLNVIRNNRDSFAVSLLVNKSNLNRLKTLISEFKPNKAICIDHDYYYCEGKEYKLKKNTQNQDYCKILANKELYADSDAVVNGIVGLDGLIPTISTLMSGKILATANKESLVCAGDLITKIKNQNNSVIYPVDSEHSTIWQLIDGKADLVKRIILTASGGAFRDFSVNDLKKAKAERALSHPTWVMGKKVTIDSATLMNKGMEIIEAKHLFDNKEISVVMHRESIVHSLIELVDNTVLAGLSTPDMTLPIQYALTYPNRIRSKVQSLDLIKSGSLNFSVLDEEKFPCLRLAKEVNKYGDYAGTVLNAANEILVKKYIDNEIGFYDISEGVERSMQKFGLNGHFDSVEEVFCMDKQVKEYTLSIIDRLGE